MARRGRAASPPRASAPMRSAPPRSAPPPQAPRSNVPAHAPAPPTQPMMAQAQPQQPSMFKQVHKTVCFLMQWGSGVRFANI